MRNHLLLYCRPGFESDMAGEIQGKAAAAGVFGYVKTQKNSGYVVYVTQEPDGAWQLMDKLRFDELIFARQWCAATPLLADIPQTDRVSAILDAIQAGDFPRCGDVVLETADTNEAKELSGFCKKFVNPLRQALRKADYLTAKPNPSISRLHCFFLDSTNVYVGGQRYPQQQPVALWYSSVEVSQGGSKPLNLEIGRSVPLFCASPGVG